MFLLRYRNGNESQIVGYFSEQEIAKNFLFRKVKILTDCPLELVDHGDDFQVYRLADEVFCYQIEEVEVDDLDVVLPYGIN